MICVNLVVGIMNIQDMIAHPLLGTLFTNIMCLTIIAMKQAVMLDKKTEAPKEDKKEEPKDK